MPTLLTISSIIISFCITLVTIPYWIRRARNAKLVGPDVHKKDSPKVAELGGLCVIAGFLIALLFFVATKTFIYLWPENFLQIFATITAVLIATMIGFVDDILGWKIGLRARYKVALTFFISLPIVVINAGQATMNIPLIGIVDFGLLYPLLLVPIAVMGTANGFNIIAGYNGLEAGQGIIILTTLATITYFSGDSYAAFIASCMIAAILAFYIFNSYPAKIFPGDTFTYPVGALIAIVAILGNVEKYAVILFIPYFIELLLKARGNLIKESFAAVQNDGSLERRYEQWYGIEHVAVDILKKIRGKATEQSVVYAIFLFQSFFAIVALSLFFLN
jgi:UDP-N-acetylglucosamine--dolichyl-phosphate N-acetylglucosaminephosphotransferase